VHDHDHYLITAIAPDGVIVQSEEVCEDDLDVVAIHIGIIPKGGYITCLPISTSLN
jgi:hypothetical protein